MCTTNRHRFSLFNYDSDHFRVGLGIVCCNNVLHNRAYFFVTVDEARKITSLPFTQTIILIESVFVYHIIPDPVRNNSGPIQDHFLTILHQPIEFLTIIPQPVTPSAPPLPEILWLPHGSLKAMPCGHFAIFTAMEYCILTCPFAVPSYYNSRSWLFHLIVSYPTSWLSQPTKPIQFRAYYYCAIVHTSHYHS